MKSWMSKAVRQGRSYAGKGSVKSGTGEAQRTGWGAVP